MATQFNLIKRIHVIEGTDADASFAKCFVLGGHKRLFHFPEKLPFHAPVYPALRVLLRKKVCPVAREHRVNPERQQQSKPGWY